MLQGTKPFGRLGLRAVRNALAGLMVVAAVSGATTVVAHAAKYAAIVVDANTGKVLHAKNADSPRYPASLTKMMTLYLLFGALDSGKLTMDTRLKVSAFAAAQSPTKLGLKVGSTISVREAMLGLITKSANDAAVVIAENLAGSESAFAKRMTSTARRIGMTNTTFRNASGLPNPGQVSTARDMATLGRALAEHYPEYYKYFSTRSFVFRGRTINGHNNLLGRVDGVDGIKTGYIRASGFNLVSSMRRNGRHLVATVIGGTSGRARDAQMQALLEQYIGKASRRSGGALIARAGQEDAAPALLALAPSPRPRPELVAAAEEVGSIVADEPETVDVYDAVVAAEDKPVADPKVVTASVVPVANPLARNDDEEIAQGDIDDGGAADAAAIMTASADSGWKIQIAASPTAAGADSMLDKARAAAPQLLAQAVPQVETVKKGKSTLYRARFAGFSDKDAAWAACGKLEKHDFSCLAIRR
ncbi:D-alanyl-D-alanine carboxypeptidase [Prosthecomicrobium pneumaticum]|nr:D-alanyl-D-alanine carboxypeptidase [Prosthecomicrobium pneumaticum]